MKKIFLLAALVLLHIHVFAQITTKHVAKYDPLQDDAGKYDSSTNFMGSKVKQYIGQQLYVLPKHKDLQKYGYEGFLLDYKKDKYDNDNVYHSNGSYNSKYEDMQGKYFEVLEVIRHPNADDNPTLYGKYFFLKLKFKDNDQTLYFQYDSLYDFNFPFLVVGHFEKAKKEYKGKEFVGRGINWMNNDVPMTDINTGKPVSFEPGSLWKCVDFTVEETYYTPSLILQNDKGEQIPLPEDDIYLEKVIFVKVLADHYKKEFGDEIWKNILDRKIVNGMTHRMVKIALGTPEKTEEEGSSDLWIYKNGTGIIFTDGKVVEVKQ